ncbi:hypothetical protein IGI04_011030, partial [Brassica rapa subsp. trilocularis]
WFQFGEPVYIPIGKLNAYKLQVNIKNESWLVGELGFYQLHACEAFKPKQKKKKESMQSQCKTLAFTFSPISSNHKLPFPSPINLRACKPPFPSFRSSARFIRNCASPNGSISRETEEVTELVQEVAEVEVEEVKKIDDLADQSIWGQMKEIVMFTGPAAGLWICGPLMSLIDTAVIGQGSSVELAALGDDKDEVQHQISILLFIGLACGVVMMALTRLYGSGVLTGAKNAEIVPAANTYVQVLFYSLLVYFATSMGTSVIAAHQVMLQTYNICTILGEPLSQTAQSFMPELLFGINRNLPKARMLLKSLVIIGATLGIVVGTIGTAIPWMFPTIFTQDKVVTFEMHKVIIPYFLALSITPSTLSLEGTLLAGRDLRYISLSTAGCLAVAGLLLMLLSNGGFGLRGCWFALVGFQWARFSLALVRLLSREGVLYSEDTSRYAEKVKAT